MTTTIELNVNGVRHRLPVEDDDLLLDVLRTRTGVTSAREGCGVGACGACTVLADGRSVSACLARAVRYDGAEITTADGLPEDDPVVDAFVARRAMQCGYCIPGFVLMSHELLAENPDPGPAEIAGHLEGNICRCGTYQEIVAAVRDAAALMGENA
ncbi:MAG TPA: (2Fe-2S)-binding protein [Streptosporangiaceae bacterium]|jgi:aerobic-type carbon monoxide dehydrogenase small subunit (CoxS/CutS family)